MDTQTPRERLGAFYAKNHLPPDGGQSAPYVEIALGGGIRFYFPNFDARRKAVIKHDIHHLLTEYDTTLAGESEISAWEIASGCRSYPAAFFINTSGVMLGLFTHFNGVLKAYARGRRTRNLYNTPLSTEQALDTDTQTLKHQLGLDVHSQESRPTAADVFSLWGFVIFGSIYSLMLLLFLPFVMGYTLYVLVSKNSRPASA